MAPRSEPGACSEDACLDAAPWCRLEALAPLPAVALGLWVASRFHVPLGAFAPNVAAAGVGLALLVAARQARTAEPARWGAVALVAWALIASTLIAPPLDGVHRWLPLGPLRLHVASAIAPALVAALLRGLADSPRAALGLAAASMAVLAAQPDAALATALAAALAPAIARSPALAARWRAAGLLALAVGVAVAWWRPDPLPSIAHVEGIVGLARELGPLPLAAAVIALALLLVPFVRRNATAGALGRFVGALALVGVAANHPVPVMGAGAGPVLGWYLALACARRP